MTARIRIPRAFFEPHWSFVPPMQPEISVARDADGCKKAVDRFVLVEPGAQELAPGPDADGATLLRRLLLTPTGLPPTPEELGREAPA